MSTLSIPIGRDLEEFIDQMLAGKKAETKAEVVRRALELLKEEEAMKDLLEAKLDVERGRVYGGDLRKLAQKIK